MMLPTMRNTQLTGWLRKAPMRDRLQAEESGASTVQRGFTSGHEYRRLPQKI